jgi:hypothetical protein
MKTEITDSDQRVIGSFMEEGTWNLGLEGQGEWRLRRKGTPGEGTVWAKDRQTGHDQ